MNARFSSNNFWRESFNAGWDCGLLKIYEDKATDLDWWAVYCAGGEL